MAAVATAATASEKNKVARIAFGKRVLCSAPTASSASPATHVTMASLPDANAAMCQGGLSVWRNSLKRYVPNPESTTKSPTYPLITL